MSFEKIKNYLRHTDYLHILLCVALSVISVTTLFSVGSYGGLDYGGVFGNFRPAIIQIVASILGMVFGVACSFIDIKQMLKFWPFFAAISWGMVLLTFIPGVGYAPAGTQSQSWIVMPFGASFQPTEIAKISFYLTFAMHLATVRTEINRPKKLVPVLLHLVLPALIVHFQGDDGTALVFFAIGLIMLFAAGLNRWYVIASAATFVASLPLIWTRLLTEHQRNRILGLIFPENFADTTMYQQLQGCAAISEGGFFGRGLFQPKHTYIPLAENDFVFSYYAESVGFVGVVVLLVLLFAIMYKTIFAAIKAKSYSEAYVCVGVFAAMLVQTVVNIGMNLILIPVSGLTLPFVSAGGTSVLMLYLSVGLVMAVSRKNIQAKAMRKN